MLWPTVWGGGCRFLRWRSLPSRAVPAAEATFEGERGPIAFSHFAAADEGDRSSIFAVRIARSTCSAPGRLGQPQLVFRLLTGRPTDHLHAHDLQRTRCPVHDEKRRDQPRPAEHWVQRRVPRRQLRGMGSDRESDRLRAGLWPDRALTPRPGSSCTSPIATEATRPRSRWALTNRNPMTPSGLPMATGSPSTSSTCATRSRSLAQRSTCSDRMALGWSRSRR